MRPQPDALDRAERTALRRLRQLIRDRQRRESAPKPATPKTSRSAPKGRA